jgi:CubicO group peptidase (beta-lactamase class C family)
VASLMESTSTTATVEPEEVGLSAARLARLRARLEGDVAAGEILGAVALIYRGGRVAWSEAIGTLDGHRPMPLDAVFRIYSMTKPLTSLAAMLLEEEGRLLLSDDVGEHLPALAAMEVEVDGRTEPARRPITVHDLLRHTAGLSGGESGTRATMRRYAAADIRRWDHTHEANRYSGVEFVERLGSVPLAHHPGDAWEYSRAGDALGVLVEVVSGMSLEGFCRERLLGPSGMSDTGWHLRDAEARDRLAAPAPTPGHQLPEFADPAAPLRLQSGGSGAFSTAADYLRFARLLLGRGEVDGVRVAGRKTIETMTADHLGPRVSSGPDYLPGEGYGFGLGFAVREGPGRSPFPGSPGDYWWLGRAGTSFFVDPAEDLIGILMVQKYWRAFHYQRLFRSLVYQALVD